MLHIIKRVQRYISFCYIPLYKNKMLLINCCCCKIVYQKTDEWYIEWQRVTTSGTTNDNEWQRVTISANFSFFQIREEPTTKHPKENSLNLEDDLWRRPIKLRAKTSTQEETSNSKKQELQKQLFADFHQNKRS